MPVPSDLPDRRTMAARIILATHLPMPKVIHFMDANGVLSLTFGTVAEGEAWAAEREMTYCSRVRDGFRHLDAGGGQWHGWYLILQAIEVEPEFADADRDALTELVAQP